MPARMLAVTAGNPRSSAIRKYGDDGAMRQPQLRVVERIERIGLLLSERIGFLFGERIGFLIGERVVQRIRLLVGQ